MILSISAGPITGEQFSRYDTQAMTDAGWKRNYRIQHMEVRVYGNAALVTGYMTGSMTAPDGTVTQLRLQRTGMMVKQGGQWREAHRHASPLFPQ